jgi:hypothetical protein
MKTITDDLIEKFIEAGLINLKSIDQARSLEMIREEFKKLEREAVIQFAYYYANERVDRQDLEKEYEQTYGGGEQ